MMPKLYRSPSLGQVIENAISDRLLDVHTALPARIERYDASRQMADVKPLIQANSLLESGAVEAEPLPVICDVPVVFPGAGGFRLTFPVKEGDYVLLVFAEASMDTWLEVGGDPDPRDYRRHHLADAIAIVGLHPVGHAHNWANVSGETTQLGTATGPKVVITESEVRLGALGDEPVPDAAIKGTSYRAAEETLFAQQAGVLGAAGAALATAGASLNTAGIDPTFSVPYAAASAAIVAAGAAVTGAATALSGIAAVMATWAAAVGANASFLSSTARVK